MRTHTAAMLRGPHIPSSADPDRPSDPSDQRRLRRMISNRESARRSRLRKQRHIEDLLLHAARLRAANSDLAARLTLVAHHCSLYRAHNDLLRNVSAALRRRLSELRRIVFLRQLQRLSQPSVNCGGFGSNEQTLSSLIA